MDILPIKNIMQTNPAHKRHPHDIAYENGAAFTFGRYCSLAQAMVPIFDPGFYQADAVYDVVSVSRGHIFRFEEHLDRFERSCGNFQLMNPYSKEETTDILTNLVKLTGLKDALIYWCVTRGLYSNDGFPDRIDFSSYDNQFYAYIVPYGSIVNERQQSMGLNIMVSKKYRRIPPNSVDPTVKNFHGMDLKLALFEASKEGYEWSVLLDSKGNLTESAGANIFVLKNKVLFTPDSGCLKGITRKTTIELCEELGLSIKITEVSVKTLLTADEAFMTSTAGGIMPINSVDDNVLGGVVGPGEFSTKITNLYWEKRWKGWLGTPIRYDEELSRGIAPIAT